jgi:exodeoxyribonuclease VIII
MRKLHILLDIETLGVRPGAQITEIGAISFCPETGEIMKRFEVFILPENKYHVDPITLDWRKQNGTWPTCESVFQRSMKNAIGKLNLFVLDQDGALVEAVWAWGAVFDFSLLRLASKLESKELEWDYWQERCARTVWQTAFGDRKHAERPHRALEDCQASLEDLKEAIAALRGGADAH